MDPLFAQPYCSVAPYQKGSPVVAGAKQSCAVFIDDGQLLIRGAHEVIDAAPVAQVQLDTPALQAKVGASTFVHMNGREWVIDFGTIVQYDTGAPRGPFKKMKFAKERNREFADLLTRGGATNLRA